MDDNLSTKSSESSISTSCEYEIVIDTNVVASLEPVVLDAISAGNKSPTLGIASNRNICELRHEMTDALRELALDREGDGAASLLTTKQEKSFSLPHDIQSQQVSEVAGTESTTSPKTEEGSSISERHQVGHSIFYDYIDASPAEKQDAMKPEKGDKDDGCDIDQGCTIFAGVTYLGASTINAPRSEIDIYRIMSDLNGGSTNGALKISISIPNCAEGLVILHDAESNSVFAMYEIRSIILYFRGPVETVENGCFAFTRLQGESLYQCHVFRCHIAEAVNQVSACFQKAFQTYTTSIVSEVMDSSMMDSVASDISGKAICTAGYEFIVLLEIREQVAKNSYTAVPRDRNCFKLRANTNKEVCITVKQTPSTTLPPLFVERCFGVLLSPGKLVRQADMQLIDMISMGYLNVPASVGAGDNVAATNTSSCLKPYQIRAEWKVHEKAFDQLNMETSKTFLTVAIDIVIRGIKEPVRFVIETPVTIQSPGEIRIMDHFNSKRPMTLRYYLQLKRTAEDFAWEVSSIDPSEEIAEPQQQQSSNLLKFGMTNLSRIVRSTSIVSIEDDCPTDYSSDGDEPLLSGTGEVSKDCSQDTLDEWDPILKEWDGEKRPKYLAPLVRLGVPEALREKVWQKLGNVENRTDMLDMYKTLITKETKCEAVIQRDIHRTFPAHKLFKESGGSGQDALFKVSKAYAVYDSEVGYCQGLSFIAASLLLHMPEEDAFCLLVALMYDYGLRDLYKHGFESLHLRFYQLDRLLQAQLPRLHEHFQASGIETHMYASQWFLTLFTARFPLCFVFHVLDVFLLDGLPLLFQVALTLLSISEGDLRQLDLEGILKYFRVSLPKKCRSAGQARRIMKMVCDRKVKKLKQYEEEFLLKKQHMERMEKEAQIYENRFGEERSKLQAKLNALQLKLNEANDHAVEKEKKHIGIVQEYKQIIQRLEHDMTTLNTTLGNVMNMVSKCQRCSKQIDGNNIGSHLSDAKVDEMLPLGPLDPLNMAIQRTRELELELARVKLAQVEAECRNQDLNHQLNTTISEMQTNRTSWQPWLSKTFNTLQEKVTPRIGRESITPTPTFQSYASNISQPNLPVDAKTSSAGSETN